MSHAEDMEISPWDYRLAEDIETVRNCWLSEYYQTKLHMCHVSTRGALDAIQMAKLRGAPVTCEVTPHHLWFTNDTCDYRVNPPIRTADDVQALVDGIRTGIVDAIATDHAPHSEEDKLKGMAGMVGSETAFGVCYTKLCKQEGLPLEVLVHLMSTARQKFWALPRASWSRATMQTLCWWIWIPPTPWIRTSCTPNLTTPRSTVPSCLVRSAPPSRAAS